MTQFSQQFEFQLSGREKELEDLDEIVNRSLNREGGLAFIIGELGVGKTRLARAISEKGKKRGFTCLTAKSPRGGSFLPYSVWVECLRQLTEQMSVKSFFEACGNFSQQIMKLLPELGATRNEPRFRDTIAEPKQIILDLMGSSPVQIFDAVAQFFYRLSDQSPLLIVLDDLQWCDQTSLDLLRYLAGSSFRSHRIVVLCISRDTYLETENPSLHKLISEFSTSENLNKIIRLERFDAADTRRLIGNAIGLGNVSEAFCDLLHRKTGGNPFFLKETLSLLLEKNEVRADQTTLWESTLPNDFRVPDTVEEVVRQRLAPLEKELVEVLRLAALIGEDFDIEILREASGLEEGRLSNLIQAATKAGIVRKVVVRGRSLHSFSDEILMDVLAEVVNPERLVAHHLAIGQIMEHAYSDKIDDHSGEIASHFQKGADWRKCFEYSTKAADYAASTFAHEEASKYYSMALESLNQLGNRGPTRLRGETLEKLGDQLGMLGNSPASFRLWEEALRAYEGLNESGKAASLHRKMGWRYAISYIDKGNEQNALRHYKEALKLLEKEPSGPSLCYLYHHLAEWHWFYGDIETGREYGSKSIEIARAHDIPEIEALSTQILGFTSHIDSIDAALENFKRSEQLPIKLGNPQFWTIGRVEWFLGLAYRWTTDDTPKTITHLLNAIEAGKKDSAESSLRVYRGTLAFWGYLPSGEWSKARDEVYPALAWPPLEFVPFLRELVYVVLGNVNLREGELEEAEMWLLKGYKGSHELPGLAGSAFVWGLHASLAQLYLDRGDDVRAEKYLREGYSNLKTRGLIVDTASGFSLILGLLVRVCESQGKRREALTFLGELGNLAKLANQDWARAYYFQTAGFLALGMEEWEKSVSDYEESIKYWKSLARPYELAKVYYELGLAHQSIGKIESASSLFENARAIFEKLGAKLDLKKVLTASKDVEDSDRLSIIRLRGSAKENSKIIFDYLAAAFIADFYSKKAPSEISGWRTFLDIAKETKIPKSVFYQRESKDGGGLAELEHMGLIEVRIYSGERGRGGNITRARIAYDKEEIKNYISKRVEKTSRNIGS